MTARHPHLDTANRSFVTLLGVVLVPYLLLGVFGCGLLTIVGRRVAEDGFSSLSAGPGDLRPLVAFFGIVAAGTVVAVASFARQLRATRLLVARVRAAALPLPPPLGGGATRAGLSGRVDLVDSDETFSFAYGFPRTRVAVSRALVDNLDPDELAAVLHHERHHVRNHDPLKVVVARVASSAFFFLPAVAGLRTRYRAASELAADRRAMERVGRAPLAGALYRVVRGPAWDELATAAAIGGPEFLSARVAQLETGREPAIDQVSRIASIATAAAVGLMVVALVTSVVAAGGVAEVMRASQERSAKFDLGWYDLLLAVPVGLLAVRLRASGRHHCHAMERPT